MFDTLGVSDFQALFSRNYGYADPDSDFSFWSSSTAKGAGNLSINFTQYTTPQMDQDLQTGRTSGYPDIRKKAYDDLAGTRRKALQRTIDQVDELRTRRGLEPVVEPLAEPLAMRHPELTGPVNAVAPESVTNAQLTEALARVLVRRGEWVNYLVIRPGR